jgi:hypothetical protein
MSSAEQTPVSNTTTRQLDEVQEQLVQATLANLNITSPPPPAATTPTAAGDIRTLVSTGSLTVAQLEAFLNANCRWHYSGGYAALLWAKHDNQPQIPAADLDILLEPGSESRIRTLMFGTDTKEGSITADGYKVTLFETDDGAFQNMTQLGTAWVRNRDQIAKRYLLNAQIAGLGGNTNTEKQAKREQRVENLRKGMEQEAQKRTATQTTAQTPTSAPAETPTGTQPQPPTGTSEKPGNDG